MRIRNALPSLVRVFAANEDLWALACAGRVAARHNPAALAARAQRNPLDGIWRRIRGGDFDRYPALAVAVLTEHRKHPAQQKTRRGIPGQVGGSKI